MARRVVDLGMGLRLTYGRPTPARPAPAPLMLGQERVPEPTILDIPFRVGDRRIGCGTAERPHRLTQNTGGHFACACGTVVTKRLYEYAVALRAGDVLDVTPLIDKKGLHHCAVLAGSEK